MPLTRRIVASGPDLGYDLDSRSGICNLEPFVTLNRKSKFLPICNSTPGATSSVQSYTCRSVSIEWHLNSGMRPSTGQLGDQSSCANLPMQSQR